MDFDTECGNILLLEFTCQVTLDEGSLSKQSVHVLSSVQTLSRGDIAQRELSRTLHTFPVPPSPTKTSLKVGTPDSNAAMVIAALSGFQISAEGVVSRSRRRRRIDTAVSEVVIGAERVPGQRRRKW